MNPIHVLRDAWFFFSRHLAIITALCLPWVLLETLAQQQLAVASGGQPSPLYEVLVALLFYPLYTSALILFMDARSDGGSPRLADLLAAGLSLWPRFALLAGITTTAVLLGASLFILPALWVMAKLAFTDYLLVLRGLSPLQAVRQSFQLSTGHFWPILVCLMTVMVPLWILDGWIRAPGAETLEIGQLLLGCGVRFLQLFATVVGFRLFMLRTTLEVRERV